jgi:1,4-alpha-glucan branching enzyme
MKKQPCNKSTVGRRRVEFRLDRPIAKTVSVAGDFNNWNVETHRMLRDKHGVWKKVVMVLPGRHEYRFFADGKWCNDPSSSAKCSNCFGSQNDFIVVSP